MSSFDLRHIAKLARLKLTDEELKVFEGQVSGILDFVDQLKAVDVSGVEPTSHPLELKDVFREDAPKPSLAVEPFLVHAPRSKGRFFEVPKVIEGKE